MGFAIITKPFFFEPHNRLIQADSTLYRYNAENQRIGVNQTQYVINSQPALSQVLVKTEASGTQTYYVYGLGLIGQETAGEYSSYHFDYRGSTVALTDETGLVLERFQYSPYGLQLSGDASRTQFLFNGNSGVMTDSNGLYHMRALFYSPSIRRFVNQDILLGRITEGQTLNRYAYVTGRPVSFVDPFGLEGTNWLDFIFLSLLYGGTGEPIMFLPTTRFPARDIKLSFDIKNGILTINSDYQLSATSGSEDCMNVSACADQGYRGPLPLGNYTADVSMLSDPNFIHDLYRNLRHGDWGDWRVVLVPNQDTQTFGRYGFFLHGGMLLGSAGCIDIGGGIFGNQDTTRLLDDLLRYPDDIIEIEVR
ncbi:MAG: hypothetical protein DRQ99_32790 [Candidatus Parabeggiatoa sp. nov. 3]|nr:MAG: hypothetical protein DRQ99_32790 [Gammaproteobacteria bacterium]